MSGTDEEPGSGATGSRSMTDYENIGIGPPSNVTVPAGETVTGPPGRFYTGDPGAAPERFHPWPPGGRWLIPPQELAAREQRLLKEELGRLARDGSEGVAVADGTADGEVWFVLPVRTVRLSEPVQAILRRR